MFSAKGIDGFRGRARAASARLVCDLRAKIACEKGQGTTEYAILVGVLTELDNVLGKKHEVRGLPCFR